MSKRVSLEEKRTRMLEIFYEKQEFFNFKEIEKIASKEKGIVLQSVKDVLQALVDDGLVKSDKVGSSIYYWAFPGEKMMALEQRCAEMNKSIVDSQFKLQKLHAEKKILQVGREDTEEKKAVLAEIEKLKEREEIAKKMIEKLSDNDPEVIEKISKRAEEYKAAANTWTDNIFAIQSWCKNKFDIKEETLNKQFRIPMDLDYVE